VTDGVATAAIDSPDTAAIARVFAAMVDAWNRHDPHAFAAIFATDADFTNVRGATAHGRRAIEAFHAPFFQGQVFKDSQQTAVVRTVRFLSPTIAAVDVDSRMTGARTPDGQERPLRLSRLSVVMTKNSADRWFIAVFHNTELPPA
jgi:uncharacterized protein (TIGR02246 family)